LKGNERVKGKGGIHGHRRSWTRARQSSGISGWRRTNTPLTSGTVHYSTGKPVIQTSGTVHCSTACCADFRYSTVQYSLPYRIHAHVLPGSFRYKYKIQATTHTMVCGAEGAVQYSAGDYSDFRCAVQNTGTRKTSDTG